MIRKWLSFFVSVFFLLCTNLFFGQNSEEKEREFWKAVSQDDIDNVISIGNDLLYRYKNSGREMDTIEFQIRLYTGGYLNFKKKFNEALELNVETFERCVQFFGSRSIETATILNFIGMNQYAIAEFQSAKVSYVESLDILKATIGVNTLEYAQGLSNLAVLLIELDEFNLSLAKIEESSRIYRLLLGENHPEFGRCLDIIGSIYEKLGLYLESIKYHDRASKIFLNNFGNENLDYANSLNSMAVSFNELGDYSSALYYYFRAYSIRTEILGANDLDCAISCSNICTCYNDLGDYLSAIEFCNKSIAIKERVLGKLHPSVAISLDNLASVYCNQRNYLKAIELSINSLQIKRQELGIESLPYSLSLNNLAYYYSCSGQLDKSLSLYQEAFQIRQRILGDNHPLCISTLSDIGVIYFDQFDYKKAFENGDLVLKLLDPNSENYSEMLFRALWNMSLSEMAFRRSQQGITHLIEAYQMKANSYFQNSSYLSSSLSLSSKRDLENCFYVLSSYGYGYKALSEIISRSWLNLNGSVSCNSINFENQIVNSGDTTLINLLTDLKLSKKQLAKYRELTKEEKTSRGIDEKALEDQVSNQERELSKQSKAFADFNRRFNLKDVSSALKGDEVFVDIARVPYFSTYTNQWTDSVKYLVFIHNSTDSLVEYCFIDNGKEIEGEIFADYKIDCSSQASATELKNALYYNSFWRPIAERIGSAKTVYVSLGGVYNNINLNTLYNPETGKYLLEEKDIRIVNSAREFILSKEQTARTYTSTSSALYGFPDFNASKLSVKDTTDFLALTRDLDPFWVDSLTRGGLKASLLPATKIEIEQIAKSFEKNGWQVKEYLGDNASEANLKNEVSPRVLHIATHGYFFEDIPDDNSNNNRFLGMERQRVVQDPMLRSGLLFAGANKTLQGENVEGENGLLSATEASLLNLRETELVVLSACETGKGEVKNSEGVYGLRKAFSDAGASNTIMSLWKVDDKVTQEFMTRFYEIWLNEKTTIREAFNRTQLEIKSKYPKPYYWGAFILVGD